MHLQRFRKKHIETFALTFTLALALPFPLPLPFANENVVLFAQLHSLVSSIKFFLYCVAHFEWDANVRISFLWMPCKCIAHK